MSAAPRLATCVVTVALLAAACPAARAAGERLRVGMFTPGVVAASDGTNRLRANLAQPAAGASTGAAGTVCAGFWCFGGISTLAVDPPSGDAPRLSFAVGMPSPNPARGAARFAVTLPERADVTFAAFDVAGRAAGPPVTQSLGAGVHDVSWKPAGERPGIYFVRVLVAGQLRAERRVVTLR